MPVWATMCGAEWSPAPGRPFVRLVRRITVVGLTVGVALLLMLTPASAASASTNDGPGHRDVRGVPNPNDGRARPVRDSTLTSQGRTQLPWQAAGRSPIRDVGGPEASGERAGGAGIATPSGATGTTVSVSGPGRNGDVQRQGSVVAVFEDPADPLIVVAVENGYVTIRLRCGILCPIIHRGDYVIAEGRRRSEAVFDAEAVWVVAP